MERQIRLEEKVSKEQRALELEEPIQSKPIHTLSPPHKSNRIFRPLERNLGIISKDIEKIFLIENRVHGDDPKIYGEVISDINFEKQLEAMKLEIDLMHLKLMGTLVDPPEGIIPIGCKQIYKKKFGVDEKVKTFKARLIEKWYKQCEGIDYQDTFSLVAMLKSICTLLAIATYFNYEIWQMDVKMVFLNRYLEKDIYIEQLLGFTFSDSDHKVCKLQRSIYGLKQAS